VNRPPHPQPRSTAPERVDPFGPLFRLRAVEAYAAGADGSAVLRVVRPGVAATVIVLLSTLAAVVVLAVVLRIEVTSEARGVLAATRQPRAVSAEIAGVVSKVHVHSGDRVAAGDELVTLDSSELRSRLVASEHRLSEAEATLLRLNGLQKSLHDAGLQILTERHRILRRKLESQGRLLGIARKEIERANDLVAAGAVSATDRESAAGDLVRLDQARADLEDHLAQVRFQRAEQDRQRDLQVTQAGAARREAESQRDAVRVLLRQTVVRAPHDGVVESLTTHVGELLQPGTVVARVVPAQIPTRAILFLEERERRFVGPGSRARIEVDGLPVGEFGYLTGEVERVAVYPASAHELGEILGARTEGASPRYRAELVLLPEGRFASQAHRLRSGAGVRAKLKLRSRRPLSLVLSALGDFSP
jgi:multidrug resistance efflux pump